MRSTKILSLLLVFMYFLSCQEAKQSTNFDLEGSSTIWIINQTNDSLLIAIESWTIVPFEAQTLDTSLAASEILAYSLKAQGKKHYNLALDQTKYRLFTQPQASDTVIINNSTKADRL